jgi:hypothetical protein
MRCMAVLGVAHGAPSRGNGAACAHRFARARAVMTPATTVMSRTTRVAVAFIQGSWFAGESAIVARRMHARRMGYFGLGIAATTRASCSR